MAESKIGLEKLDLNFGLLIAYVVPGFLGLYAISGYAPPIADLLGGPSHIPAGGALFPLLVLSLASGMVINSIAWGLVRPLIEFTGVRRPKLDYSKLRQETMEVYKETIEQAFRHYQSYSNLLVAQTVLGIDYAIHSQNATWLTITATSSVILLLFVAARDSLRRSYETMAKILKEAEQ